MKTKVPRKKVETVKKANKTRDLSYIASIKVFGKNYVSSGATIREAIERLNPGSVAKGMTILTLSREDATQSKIINNIQTMRLFNRSPQIREVSLKQVSSLFNL